MSKKKKRNHFVPVMYFSNFYSEIDNATINAQKNMVTCYRIPDKELFWDKGKNIGCKKSPTFYKNVEYLQKYFTIK